MLNNLKTAEKAEDIIFTPRSKQESNEVIIVIRDGKVIQFEQKKFPDLEGMYGDGI